jgi:ribonuclease HI
MQKEFVKHITPSQRKLYELRYTVFTDGSCDNTKAGGWAAVIIDSKGKKTIVSGNVSDTTNNQMELMAILEALEWILEKYDDKIKKHVQINLNSDSTYCVNSIRYWIPKWEEENYLLPGTETLRPNAKLLEKIYELTKKCKFEVKWINRNSCENSTQADEACKAAREYVC